MSALSLGLKRKGRFGIDRVLAIDHTLLMSETESKQAFETDLDSAFIGEKGEELITFVYNCRLDWVIKEIEDYRPYSCNP
jgi:hypothetical protein